MHEYQKSNMLCTYFENILNGSNIFLNGARPSVVEWFVLRQEYWMLHDKQLILLMGSHANYSNAYSYLLGAVLTSTQEHGMML
jgi:hypothetical protein